MDVIVEPRQGTVTVARCAHADPQASAAASPRLEEGRARTLEPWSGGSPHPRSSPSPRPNLESWPPLGAGKAAPKPDASNDAPCV